ncbi:MAG: DUF4954 family protein, partial [Prevotella sp.]|nr:DUF4954 family protein [Prevotella sp.]
MRLLTEQEINALRQQGCTAEDWTDISVSEEFSPDFIHRVRFYGEIQLGVFEKSLHTGNGFARHSGIFDATLRNVAVGDNCLIERVGVHINNYIIGDDSLIQNVGTIETTEGATFGEGTHISVLTESGAGNVILYSGLTAQTAALQVKYEEDKEFIAALNRLVRAELNTSERIGSIGNRCRITNVRTILNCIIGDDCETDASCRLSDCSLCSTPDAPVYIGSGVVCENTIICDGTSILNSAKLENCFVGQACRIMNGYTAENSIFFANCQLSNGEACAAFCGPFTTSHHKSSLLIGTATSFYNAGSGTNFSNHAYKLGPVHRGIMRRGVKTGSETHVLLPAEIGQYSVCFGKIYNHPDTNSLPFSYLFGTGNGCTLVPGRNFASAGFWRDINKWRKRDKRTNIGARTIINFDWLSPYTVEKALAGKQILENLQCASGGGTDTYTYNGCTIKASSLVRGIELYTLVLDIFFGEIVKQDVIYEPASDDEISAWSDLAGMFLPLSEEERIIEEVK